MLLHVVSDIMEKYSEESTNLSKLYYEKDAHEAILSYMINNNFMDSENYQRIWLEYIKVVAAYNNAAAQYYDDVVVKVMPENIDPKTSTWTLDFIKEELRFYDAV